MHLSLDLLMESCSVSFNLSQLCHRKELFWQVCQLLSCYSVLWQVVKLSVVSTLQCSDNLWAVETSTSLVLQKGWYQGNVKTSFFGGLWGQSLNNQRVWPAHFRHLSDEQCWRCSSQADRVHEHCHCAAFSLAADNVQTTWTGLLGVVLLSNMVWFSSNEMYWIV